MDTHLYLIAYELMEQLIISTSCNVGSSYPFGQIGSGIRCPATPILLFRVVPTCPFEGSLSFYGIAKKLVFRHKALRVTSAMP
jgi:hypothetical protein